MDVNKPRLPKNALRNQVAAHMQTALVFHHQFVIRVVVLDTEFSGLMVFLFCILSFSIHFES